MSNSQQDQQEVAVAAARPSSSNRSSSSNSSELSSPSNSISLIKLDELSTFGATKQGRLPALIKLNDNTEQHQSMPAYSATQIEQNKTNDKTDKMQQSLPAQFDKDAPDSVEMTDADKENQMQSTDTARGNGKRAAEKGADEQSGAGNEKGQAANDEGDDDFQVVDMVLPTDLVGPSLPQPIQQVSAKQVDAPAASRTAPVVMNTDGASGGQQPSHLGDSLIDMIISLRNDNQNLVRALETNNEYVKERLSEFKRCQEESKRREAQFALDKAEYEHQIRKLKRQNDVLSERLKSMEAKLKDMKLEVSESLQAANSSKVSSVRDGPSDKMYPNLELDDSFGAGDITMQVDTASGELLNEGDRPLSSIIEKVPSAPQMTDSMQPGTSKQQHRGQAMDDDDDDEDSEGEESSSEDEAQVANQVGQMTKEELSKRFDANKAEFYAIKDPLKQCDKLEQQLNDIGKRDYEICLLQQQLNIYRQDFRLERMANLEAKLQIEKLKNDIDRLCLERLQERANQPNTNTTHPKCSTAAEAVSKIGHHLSRKAAKSAAKAAKYAAKQAKREERYRSSAAAAAAAAAAATASSSAPGASGAGDQAGTGEHEHYHGRHHHGRRHNHHHSPGHHRTRGPRSEVVSDLLSTANKAVMTGYRMASTHVNLALDKLNQYEQSQASQLAQTKPQQQKATGSDKKGAPSAPIDMASID